MLSKLEVYDVFYMQLSINTFYKKFKVEPSKIYVLYTNFFINPKFLNVLGYNNFASFRASMFEFKMQKISCVALKLLQFEIQGT